MTATFKRRLPTIPRASEDPAIIQPTRQYACTSRRVQHTKKPGQHGRKTTWVYLRSCRRSLQRCSKHRLSAMGPETGADPASQALVAVNAEVSTVDDPRAIPYPAALPPNGTTPEEQHVYKITTTLSVYKAESDGDHHLVLGSEDAKDAVIGEIPKHTVTSAQAEANSPTILTPPDGPSTPNPSSKPLVKIAGRVAGLALCTCARARWLRCYRDQALTTAR